MRQAAKHPTRGAAGRAEPAYQSGARSMRGALNSSSARIVQKCDTGPDSALPGRFPPPAHDRRAPAAALSGPLPAPSGPRSAAGVHRRINDGWRNEEAVGRRCVPAVATFARWLVSSGVMISGRWRAPRATVASPPKRGSPPTIPRRPLPPGSMSAPPHTAHPRRTSAAADRGDGCLRQRR